MTCTEDKRPDTSRTSTNNGDEDTKENYREDFGPWRRRSMMGNQRENKNGIV